MIKFSRSVAIDAAFLAALLGWILYYSYPLFFHSLTDNCRQIQTYNLDSVMMLDAVKDAIARPDFRIVFDDYGHFYPNLTVLVALVYRLFSPLNDHNLFFILRGVALAGGGATILMVFIFCRAFLDRMAAWFAAALMAFTPALLVYSNEVKADSWQLFFVVLSLFYCGKAFSAAQTQPLPPNQPSRADSYLRNAALAAGAAFGTKYLGILLLPIFAVGVAFVPVTPKSHERLLDFDRRAVRLLTGLAVLFLVPGFLLQPSVLTLVYRSWGAMGQDSLLTVSRILRFSSLTMATFCIFLLVAKLWFHVDFMRREKLATWMLRGCGVALMFFVGFAVTSPWNAAHLGFVAQFFFRVAHLNVAEPFGFKWVPFLFGLNGNASDFVGKSAGVLIVIATLLLVVAFALRKFTPRVIAFLCVLGFGLIFLTVVIAGVSRVTVLYGTPMIPVFALLAAYALSELIGLLSRPIGRSVTRIAAGAVALVIVALQAFDGGKILMAYPNLVTAMTPENNEIGRWLSGCVPSDAKLMSGAYSYAPPQFNAIMANNYDPFANFKPDIVVITQKIVDETRAEIDRHPPQLSYDAEQRDHLYKILANADDWHKGPVFGGLSVYMTPGLATRVSARCP